MNQHRKIRVAALADFHYTKASAGRLKDVFVRASETADVLAICGDMTDYGLPEEAAILAQDIKTYVRIPCVAVVGNHDFESGKLGKFKASWQKPGCTFWTENRSKSSGRGSPACADSAEVLTGKC